MGDREMSFFRRHGNTYVYVPNLIGERMAASAVDTPPLAAACIIRVCASILAQTAVMQDPPEAVHCTAVQATRGYCARCSLLRWRCGTRTNASRSTLSGALRGSAGTADDELSLWQQCM